MKQHYIFHMTSTEITLNMNGAAYPQDTDIIHVDIESVVLYMYMYATLISNLLKLP